MNEDRKIISIQIFDLTDEESYEMTLSEFIQWINNKVATSVPDKFIDTVRVHGNPEYGECDSYNIVTATYERPETDHEMMTRIERQRQRTESEEESARRQYDHLKARFG